MGAQVTTDILNIQTRICGCSEVDFVPNFNISNLETPAPELSHDEFDINRKKHYAELCVSGFVRMYCAQSLGRHMPDDLQRLCVSMYFVLTDEWNTKISHEQLEFDITNNIVTSTVQSLWQETFGSMVVKKGEVKTWRLKMLSDFPDAIIGIVDKEKLVLNGFDTHSWVPSIDTRYGMLYTMASDRDLYGAPYGKRVRINHVIEMTLDMTGDEYGRLSYKINDIDYGVAFDEIEIERGYNLAMRIGNDCSIQMLN